jgi:hypothetical protein
MSLIHPSSADLRAAAYQARRLASDDRNFIFTHYTSDSA